MHFLNLGVKELKDWGCASLERRTCTKEAVACEARLAATAPLRVFIVRAAVNADGIEVTGVAVACAVTCRTANGERSTRCGSTLKATCRDENNRRAQGTRGQLHKSRMPRVGRSFYASYTCLGVRNVRRSSGVKSTSEGEVAA